MGKEGELTGEMYRISFPRSDLNVNVNVNINVNGNTVAVKPALGLMGWAGFIKAGGTDDLRRPRRRIEDELNRSWYRRLGMSFGLMPASRSRPRWQ